MNDSPTTDPDDTPAQRKVRQVEILISRLLRVGVSVSLAVVVVGTFVSFVRHPEYLHSGQDLSRLTNPSRAQFPHTIAEMLIGLRKFQGRSIAVAGLLLLIATPVVRVGVSIFAFVHERDRIFIVITSAVFLLLLLSFVLGTAG